MDIIKRWNNTDVINGIGEKMKNNYADLSTNFERLTNQKARECLQKNNEEIFELYQKKFIKKAKLENYDPLKAYVLKKREFCFSKYLYDVYSEGGEVLLYDGPDIIYPKIASAYNLLILLKGELKGVELDQCSIFMEKIDQISAVEKNIVQEEITSKNKQVFSMNDEMGSLWEEIQIFFQNICPTNWYFIRKEICKYVFVYIK